MKHFQLKSMASITHLLIYILAFLLIWEWLRPVPAVTNTGQIEIFVWFTLASAALIYLRFPFYITMPALFAGSLYGLHLIFMEGPFFSGEGAGTLLRTFAAEFTVNTGMIFDGNFAALTDFFRTFLLFTLLALVCYLLYYWVLYTRRVFFFLICTVAYITILDTFTVVDASQAVIRIVIIGFFILALLHMLNVQDEERAIGRRPGSFISPAWMYTLVTMAGAAVVAGILLPKPEPQWEDPVPFMREFAGIEGSGGARASRIGYGVNDERLGGGFEKEEGTAFLAAADGEKYWRGESKDIYTGHGWTSDPTYVESEQIFGSGIDYRMFEEGAELEEGETSIEMDEAADFELIFYPGQPVNVQNTAADSGGNTISENEIQYYTDAQGGRIQAESGNAQSVRLDSYDLTYEEPVFPMEELRNSSEEDPEDIQEYYLQLPEELPERVTLLAEEIAEDHESRYETAAAVENYFSENDFEYETENVAVPDDGEDYVDQFLFETQEGYCDNFSTSMVVMLRALDIPARWVKGFTAGEEIEELEDGRNLYEIANANAHSWVEVYFPEVGWVPFEPTRGFTNYADFEEPESSDPGIDLGEDTSGEDPNIPEPEGGVDDLLEEGGEQGGTDEDGDEGSAVFTLKNLLISIPLVIGVMILYQKQNRLQNKFFFYRYRLSGKSASFSAAYQRLLWMLANEGIPRAEGETLREYSRRVDLALSSQAMTKLTSSYEKVYYGGRTPADEWEKRKKDWEEIVRLLQA